MNQTTVQQLVGYLLHEKEVSPHVSKVIAEIDKDPQLVKLSELDSLRRDICICARLSDVICALVSARPSKSFIEATFSPSSSSYRSHKANRAKFLFEGEH